MNREVLRALQQQLQTASATTVTYRQGVVTVASPLSVDLGDSGVAVVGVSALRSYTPLVGDVVGALMFGNDMLVIGAIGGLEGLNVVGAVGQPAFQGTWANNGGAFPSATFYRDRGRVYLSGLIHLGTIATAAFTLPAGYRPPATQFFATDSNGAHARVSVTAAGVVTPDIGSNVSVDLSPISFRVA